MKIIIINPKKDFNKEQISTFKSLGSTVFIESKDYQNDKVFKDKEEKIIVLGPDMVNWIFPNEFIDKILNLKAVCLPTTGFGWIDGKYLRKKGILLTNVPKYSTESVAEYAISLMLNLVKKLPLVIKNNWKIDYGKHQGWEVKGKTIGVIGLGTIGTRVAELGQAMGMNVIYWSQKSRDKRFIYKSLDVVLKGADFIFPAMARNEKTKGMIDKGKIALMKKGAFIVSITGNDIFDFEYAAGEVKRGKLGGVALELDKKTIFDYEGNVWITPPIAWFTKEAFEEDMRIWVETVKSIVKGKAINVVN